MARHGLYSNTLPVVALASAARTNGTVNGASVDLSVFGNDFQEALFVIQSATITDGAHAFKLQDSPDGTTWTDVDSKHVQGGPVSLAAANSNQVSALGYLGGGPNQYVRLVVTTSGATTGGVFQAAAVLAEGTVEPVNRS